MSEFKEKRKRQAFQERPFLYLALGILIGIIVAAIAFVAFFMIAGSETQVSEVAPPPLLATATPIAPPIGVQGMQPTVPPMPTVVANRIQSAKLSPDGKQIAVISVDNGVSRILLNTLQQENALNGEAFVLFGEQGYYKEAIFSPDGRYLIVTVEQYGAPSDAILFDTQKRIIIEKFPQINAAAFSPDSQQLALVSASAGIRIINTTTRNLVSSLQITAANVQAVSYSSKNQIAIAANTEIFIYNASNLSAPPTQIPTNGSFIYDVVFHPDGEHIALAAEGFVEIVDMAKETRNYFGFDARQIFALAFSDDGEQLAAAGGDSGTGIARLIVWRWNTSDVIMPDPTLYTPINLVGHNHVVTDVMFADDGNLLSASWDGTVRLWNLETHSEIAQMKY